MEQKSIEELMQSITHPNKLAFLENYPKFRITKQTTAAIGINECTVYDWFNRDEVFYQAFQAIKKRIQQETIEIHEKNIQSVATDPKTPAQSRIFGSLVILRAEAPEKYREKSEHHISGDIKVISYIPRPVEWQLEEPEKPKQLKRVDDNEKSD